MVSSSVVLPMFLYLRGAKPWSSKEVWGGEMNRETSVLQAPELIRTTYSDTHNSFIHPANAYFLW